MADVARDRRLLVGGHLAVTQAIERAVARHLEEPRFGIVGDAAERPLLHGRQQRVLHGVFSDRQVTRAERPRQRRDHLPRLPAEQMINKCNSVGRHDRRNCSNSPCKGARPLYNYVGSTSRISIEPKSRCGQSLLSSTISS